MSEPSTDSQPNDPPALVRATSPQRTESKPFPALPLIMLLYLGCSLLGMDWGLYSAQSEQYLFPPESRWNAKRVAEVRALQTDEDHSRGADVDPNPVQISSAPVVLNERDDQIAELYSRYLMYSNQPDEMITLRALGQMGPAAWKLDPKLYQYGGLFIYPVGGLIKLASLVGWVQPGTTADYLVAPEQFAKFYIIGRGYVVLWGLLGLWVAYALGRQLCDWRAGALAALLFALLPVVVSLSHESKPHLPGTVLMLWAVLWALKYLESGLVRHRLMLALSCGLALGMVLSSVWILLLIPLVECLTRASLSERLARSAAFGLIAVLAYCITNPYVPINLLTNRAILESNLGNSVAMYHWGDLQAGLFSASRLLVAGSSVFVVVAGLVFLPALWGWNWRRTLIIAAPAAVMFVQFVGLADGKPGEYGRFALFSNAVLCIVLSAGLFRFLADKWYQGTLYALATASALAWPALAYLENLHHAGTNADSRYQLAQQLAPPRAVGFSPRGLSPSATFPPSANPRGLSPSATFSPGANPRGLSPSATFSPGADPRGLKPTARGDSTAIGVLRDPAPYGFPPLDFGTRVVVLLPKEIADWPADRSGWPDRLIVPLNGVEGVDVSAILNDGYYALPPGQALPPDRTPLTWANRPLVMLVHARPPED